MDHPVPLGKRDLHTACSTGRIGLLVLISVLTTVYVHAADSPATKPAKTNSGWKKKIKPAFAPPAAAPAISKQDDAPKLKWRPYKRDASAAVRTSRPSVKTADHQSGVDRAPARLTGLDPFDDPFGDRPATETDSDTGSDTDSNTENDPATAAEDAAGPMIGGPRGGPRIHRVAQIPDDPPPAGIDGAGAQPPADPIKMPKELELEPTPDKGPPFGPPTVGKPEQLPPPADTREKRINCRDPKYRLSPISAVGTDITARYLIRTWRLKDGTTIKNAELVDLQFAEKGPTVTLRIFPESQDDLRITGISEDEGKLETFPLDAFSDGSVRADANDQLFIKRAMDVRTWTHRSGKYELEGQFLTLTDGYIVHIRLMDGKLTRVPVGHMAAADRAFVNEIWGVPPDCPLPLVSAEPRHWDLVTYTWKASALCHKPLYFEEVQLERYGHSMGPYVQPAASAAHFFLTLPALPYKMGIHPPNECQYALGYYRPGSCAPYMFRPLPISLRGALYEGGIATGLVYLIP